MSPSKLLRSFSNLSQSNRPTTSLTSTRTFSKIWPSKLRPRPRNVMTFNHQEKKEKGKTLKNAKEVLERIQTLINLKILRIDSIRFSKRFPSALTQFDFPRTTLKHSQKLRHNLIPWWEKPCLKFLEWNKDWGRDSPKLKVAKESSKAREDSEPVTRPKFPFELTKTLICPYTRPLALFKLNPF